MKRPLRIFYLALFLSSSAHAVDSRLETAAPVSASHTVSGRVTLANMSGKFRASRVQIEELPGGELLIGDLDGNGVAELFVIDRENRRLKILALKATVNTKKRSYELPSECDWTTALLLRGQNRETKFLTQRTEPRRGCLVSFERESIHYAEIQLPESWKRPKGRLLTSFTDRDGRSAAIFQLGAAHASIHWMFRGKHSTLSYLRSGLDKLDNDLAAVGDFDGDERIDLLTRNSFGAYSRCHWIQGGDCRIWADLGRMDNETSHLLLGDFNGDGRDDFIQFKTGFAGTWIALSGPLTAIERPVIGLNADFSEAQRLLAGDLDGDGIDEVILPKTGGDYLDIWRAEPGAGISDVRLSIAGTSEVLSGRDGSYSISNVTSGRHELQATFPSGLRRSRFVIVQPGHHNTADILTDRLDDNTHSKGQAWGLDGSYKGPSVCTGYLPASELHPGKWHLAAHSVCPKGYAIWNADLSKNIGAFLVPFARSKEPGLKFAGSCCKLPAEDILTDETKEADECPENFIATGWKDLDDKHSRLLCTRVNTQRYQLAARSLGVFWGISVTMLHQSHRILRVQIPAAIRYGMNRFSFDQWNRSGCLGLPWGSLLVAKGVNRCTGYEFRQLQYRGQDGDPPPGTPVKMFPDCDEITDPFDPLARCQ